MEHNKLLKSDNATNGTNIQKISLTIIFDKKKIQEIIKERVQTKKHIKSVWKNNNSSIKALEEKYNLVKAKLDYIKNILMEYYVNLLRQGTDIRQIFILNRGVGIVWIVQKLKKYNIELDYSMFPSFLILLKPMAHNYLIQMAEINMKIKRLNKEYKGRSEVKFSPLNKKKSSLSAPDNNSSFA